MLKKLNDLQYLYPIFVTLNLDYLNVPLFC